MSNEGQKERHDHESDPARTPGDGWVDEGGASHLGPATHTRESAETDAAAGEEDGAKKTAMKAKSSLVF